MTAADSAGTRAIRMLALGTGTANGFYYTHNTADAEIK